MAGINEVKSLAARRQALVAESEVYRHTLELEWQNLRIYATRAKRGFQLMSAAKPLLVLLPIAGAWLRRRPAEKPHGKPRGWRRLFGSAVAGWKLYRSAAPVLATVASLRDMRSRRGARRA